MLILQRKKSFVINLEWQWLTPPTQTYGYTLFQWDNALKIWQSTSTNCDKAIKVLNVYPDLPASNTLKTWMDDPAVGLGKINVTPVSITNFNNNPTSNPDISSSPFFAATDNQLLIYNIQAPSKYVHIQAIDSAGNLSEVFTLNPLEPYKVTATVAPAGTGTVTGTGTFNCGDTTTLTATHASGFSFVEWTENGISLSSNIVISFVITEDHNVTANFKPRNIDTLDFDTYAVII